MENNYDDLHSFMLCRDDWETIIDSLYEAASDRLSRANAIGLDSTYGSILCAEGQKTRAIAEYILSFLPEGDD